MEALPGPEGDPSEIALERLRRASAAAVPEERQPEMDALLSSMEGMRAAEEQLMDAAKQLGPLPQPDDPEAQPEAWMDRADASADLYQGLFKLVDAACSGMCLGIFALSPDRGECLWAPHSFPSCLTSKAGSREATCGMA